RGAGSIVVGKSRNRPSGTRLAGRARSYGTHAKQCSFTDFGRLEHYTRTECSVVRLRTFPVRRNWFPTASGWRGPLEGDPSSRIHIQQQQSLVGLHSIRQRLVAARCVHSTLETPVQRDTNAVV